MQQCCITEHSLTFAPLNKKATILLNSVTTVLFILLFAIIHTVKLFHHHNDSLFPEKSEKGKQAISKSKATCAVCDYHFTKDADVPICSIVVQPSIIYFTVRHFYILPFTTSVGLPSSDRGPPAIV